MNIRFEPLLASNARLLSSIEEPVYIGDPCYVFPDDDWGDFCEALCKVHSSRDQAFVAYLDDVPSFIVQSTAYGDGGYPVYLNKSVIGRFGVDAGLFSLIPKSVYDEWQCSPEGDGEIVKLTLSKCWFECPGSGMLSIDYGKKKYLVDTLNDTQEEDEDDYVTDEEET